MNLLDTEFDLQQTHAAIKRMTEQEPSGEEHGGQKLLTPEEAAARKPKSLQEILDSEAGLPTVSLTASHTPKPLILFSVEAAKARRVRPLADVFNDENLASVHPFIHQAEVDDAGEPVLLSADAAQKRKPRSLAEILQAEAEAGHTELPLGIESGVKTFNINLRNSMRLQ